MTRTPNSAQPMPALDAMAESTDTKPYLHSLPIAEAALRLVGAGATDAVEIEKRIKRLAGVLIGVAKGPFTLDPMWNTVGVIDQFLNRYIDVDVSDLDAESAAMEIVVSFIADVYSSLADTVNEVLPDFKRKEQVDAIFNDSALLLCGIPPGDLDGIDSPTEIIPAQEEVSNTVRHLLKAWEEYP